MRPYYDHAGVTIYHGDCRDIIPKLSGYDAIITDPVWPNAVIEFNGWENPHELLAEALTEVSEDCKRLAIHLGCDSDPRFLDAISGQWPFFRVYWLELARPHYKGRLMYGSDVAYLFGEPPPSRDGAHVIPGRYIDSDSSGRQCDHPCPRKLNHVKQLTRWWCERSVLDPFCGAGTTLLAAKEQGKTAIGIEIEERYCEIAVRRMAQEVFSFT